MSIIVPCYNYGRFLGTTLESVLKGNFQNWECIVVDDGSKDNTREVAAAYTAQDQRIHYIYQENGGLPVARNTGIKAARGKYLQFLDSDDLLEAAKIQLQSELLEQHPEIDFVYSDLRFFPDGKENELQYSANWPYQRPWILQRSGPGKSLVKFFVIATPIMPPIPLIRKSALEKTGLFREDLRSCEDWEFWFRCAYYNLQFKWLDAPQTRSLMRMHATSMTQNRSVMIKAMLEVRGIFDQYLKDDASLKRLNQTFRVFQQIEWMLHLWQHEGKGAAWAYYQEEERGWRFRFFRILAGIAGPLRCYPVLAGLRSLYKKWHYAY